MQAGGWGQGGAKPTGRVVEGDGNGVFPQRSGSTLRTPGVCATRRPQPMTDSDHVPASLVYGPVASRRFGRSLGVSFSEVGVRACAWRCPYCQLGHLPTGPGPAVDLGRLQRETEAALARCVGEPPAAVTLAGGGEPTDHPDFAPYVRWLAQRLAAISPRPRLVLLTNGDGLGDPAKLAALAGCDAAYLKYDPGAPQGSWSPAWLGRDRAALLAAIRPLRVQTLLFARRDDGGNHDEAARRAWVAAVRPLGPVEVHLTTVERRPPSAEITAVAPAVLRAWAAASAGDLGIPVEVYA